MSQRDSSKGQRCQDCGAVIPLGAAHGLCVACLLGGSLYEEHETLIGGYRLLGRLGEGAIGEVFLAEEDRDLRRKVALKLIHTGRDSEEVLARFEAEHKTLAQIKHPGIAQIHEAEISAGGRPFIAMEYIDGLPIRDFIRTHRLSLSERLALFLQAVEALEHARQRGVLHRTLKPSNILVSRRSDGDRVVVIDLSIALPADPPVELEDLLTRIGEFIGAPQMK